jgi:hypothetical protein
MSILNIIKIDKMSTNNKRVEGKDLEPGKEYFYIDNGNKEFLGTFIEKSSEYMMESSGRSSGYEHYYIFEYGGKKEKIRYWPDEEIFFYECA